MITLETNYGDITVELDEENTPITSANFLAYVERGHYDSTIFHRVIDGFMVQGGGFDEGMKQKDTRTPIENEADKGGKNGCGTIAMARTSNPHSASTQFFINVADNAFLNHKSKTESGWGYCVFGQVVDGMDVVDKIKAVKTTSRNGHQDVPVQPAMIKRAYVTEKDNTKDK